MTIKEMRKACKMTQKEFCIYFEIPPRTLQAWENNLRTPPVYLVELIEYKLKKEGLLK
jgi:DNA-binding transcriptional regulator YiaG